MDTVKTLTSVGFDEEEAQVYEAALLLGRATITELARKAGLKRPSVYNYAETLLRHNLLTREIRGKRRLYVAQNPNKIIHGLNERRAQIEKSLPKLVEMYTSSRQRPEVEFLENKSEVRRAYLELSHGLATVRAIFSVEHFSNYFSYDQIQSLNRNAQEQGIKIYDLIEDSPMGRRYAKSGKVKNHQIRFLPKSFKFTTDTSVIGDTVFLVSYKNMMGIIIKNEDIADFFKQSFELIWESRK